MSEDHRGKEEIKQVGNNGFVQRHFGVLMTAMVSLAAVLVSGSQVWVAYINNEKAIQLSTIQRARTVISESAQHLGARKNDNIDLETRLAGITSLSLLTIDDPPIQYFEAAIDLLVAYLRTNLPNRKRDGIGIIEDRGTFRAEDIVAALNALQKIQKAGKGLIRVKLGGLNFDKSNLVDLDFTGFDFTHATFKKSFLSRTIFRNTNLLHAKFNEGAFWHTDFTGADFKYAVFRDAKFVGVKLRDTNIEDAEDLHFQLFKDSHGLTPEQKNAVMSNL